ncbi:hypothetical protein V3C99_014102 [Haemonchus contortus]|uniref:Hypotheticial protein n=1 Tax=Haemonchus contortus TaxID=6289 RepID=A0A7I5EBZ0_HAECO
MPTLMLWVHTNQVAITTMMSKSIPNLQVNMEKIQKQSRMAFSTTSMYSLNITSKNSTLMKNMRENTIPILIQLELQNVPMAVTTVKGMTSIRRAMGLMALIMVASKNMMAAMDTLRMDTNPVMMTTKVITTVIIAKGTKTSTASTIMLLMMIHMNTTTMDMQIIMNMTIGIMIAILTMSMDTVIITDEIAM